MRTSNVTKFLAASSSLGVPRDEIFHRDDLIEATPESLARVAKNILALLHVAEFPPENRGKVIQGQGPTQPKLPPLPGPYGSVRGASASTPNLTSAQRSASPSSVPTTKGRKRFSPPLPSLPTVRSDSSNESDSEGSKTAKTMGTSNSDDENDNEHDHEMDEDDVPEIVAPTPPPRSPLRSRPAVERASVADSMRASMGDSVRASLADSVSMSMVPRQSMSSQISDTTVMSSLFDVRRSRRNSDQTSRFGTLRTMTTEASSFIPSENPSLSASDAKEVVEEMVRRRSGDSTRPALRERRPSETAIVDLTRVVEENEEGSSSAKAAKREKQAADASPPLSSSPPMPIPDRGKVSQIRLGKGKWPDDFLDAFQAQKSPAASILDEEMSSAMPSRATSPVSISPPRKLSFVGVSRGTESVESLPQFPRRPTHRARHSVDTPSQALQRTDSLRPRDASPDGSVSPPRRIVPRRTSARTSQNRHGIYIPRTDSDDSPAPGSPASDELPVPFPRRVSGGGDLSIGTPPSQGVHFPPELEKVHSGSSQLSQDDRPRLPRGRFQSDIDGTSARRKPRPQSYDDAGAKPRSRIESMMNMGSASAAEASASDLMHRTEGSAVRQTLIVKEEGKPPTQFVSNRFSVCVPRDSYLTSGMSATRQLHRARTVWRRLSCTESQYGPDGRCEAHQSRGSEGGRDRSAHE